MHVGLIDIDSHNFPNLCLMKLSAYFKQQGHTASLLTPDDVLKGQLLFDTPDKFYGAVVFEENKNIAIQLARMGVIVGGTGILKETKLAPEVESMYPDYALYGIIDTAYGFLTRGCPRGCKLMKCEFCGKESTLLCDFPKSSIVGHIHGRGFEVTHLTCDNHMCKDCATSIATEVDYCPDCMEYLRGLKRNGEMQK